MSALDAAPDALPPVALPRGDARAPQRSFMMNFRANGDERAQIRTAAERSGLTVGSYLRSRVLAAPTTRAVRRPTVERTLLAQLLGQLGKCGSNLNQIARVLNSDGEDAGDIPAAVADFRAVCTEILRALGRSPRREDGGGGA